MIQETFEIEDKDYNKSFNGFLQLLSTVTKHDSNRAAIHIPTKMWQFYNLEEISKGFRIKVWLRDQKGNYFVKSAWGNLYSIKSKHSGRITIDLSLIPTDIEGKVVEVTIRYRQETFVGYGFTKKVDSHSMTRKKD